MTIAVAPKVRAPTNLALRLLQLVSALISPPGAVAIPEDEQLQTFCIDTLFWAFRSLAKVLSLSSARNSDPGAVIEFSDELRNRIKEVLGPLARNFHKTKKGGEMTVERKAIRIVARSLLLADLLHISSVTSRLHSVSE